MISRLQEIEQKTRGPQIDKRNDFMRRVLLKAAAVSGDYLPTTSKENLIRIVGENNAEQVQALKDEKYFTQCSVEIINSAGFSDSLVGRMEEVGFLMEKVPGAVTLEEAVDIINFRAPDKFYDIGTAALHAAQEENEMMNDGIEPPPPMEHEDMIVHWRAHFIDMQNLSFKRLPEEIQALKEKHLKATEMLMEQAGMKSQAFKQKLLALPYYPVFWTVTVPPDAAQLAAEPAAPQPQVLGEGAPAVPQAQPQPNSPEIMQ
jgi:hypothetical protein